MAESDYEMNSLLTSQEIVDAIRFVNEGGGDEDLAQIVTYSKRMVFIAVNTHVSSREIAEQYEGFSSFISMGDSDGLLKFIRMNMPLMEIRTSENPVLQGRTAIAFLASTCAQAARNGGLPVARCFEITQDYIKLANETENEELVHFLMLPMMLELTKAVGTEAQSYTHPVSHHAMTYVRSHLTESLDGDSVAEACGVSRKTLCTRFKQETGETFASYVRRTRVERARRLLDTTDFEVSQIAYQTGFSSQSHMQTIFKKETGFTPREWRMREINEI
ncbi:MAG: AraC family transcriptional regulator [Coriobacteriales bacterium]|nr:AraC family transcriptional regulator [Coriobacteriales bacterium]